MSARAFILFALLGLSCVKRVESEAEMTAKIAGGTVLSGQGVAARIGAPIAVQLSFKDGSPNCVMQGAVQDAPTLANRWVWLEATEGCPSWLGGRWWAELASGGTGWYVRNISTKPVTEAGQ